MGCPQLLISSDVRTLLQRVFINVIVEADLEMLTEITTIIVEYNTLMAGHIIRVVLDF